MTVFTQRFHNRRPKLVRR